MSIEAIMVMKLCKDILNMDKLIFESYGNDKLTSEYKLRKERYIHMLENHVK